MTNSPLLLDHLDGTRRFGQQVERRPRTWATLEEGVSRLVVREPSTRGLIDPGIAGMGTVLTRPTFGGRSR